MEEKITLLHQNETSRSNGISVNMKYYRDIAESMKITEVSNGLKRLQTKLDEDFIISFHQATGGKISLEWLLTGKGEMVANTAKKGGYNISPPTMYRIA